MSTKSLLVILFISFAVIANAQINDEFIETFSNLSNWNSLNNGGSWSLQNHALYVNGFGTYPTDNFIKLETHSFLTPSTKSFTLEFRWIILSIRDQSALWLRDDNGNNLIDISDYSGRIGFYTTGGISYCNRIELNRWYNIRVKIYPNSNTADYYVDGVLTRSNLTFESGQRDYSNRVRIVLGSRGGDSFMISHIKIKL